jgi:hypothetical protein
MLPGEREIDIVFRASSPEIQSLKSYLLLCSAPPIGLVLRRGSGGTWVIHRVGWKRECSPNPPLGMAMQVCDPFRRIDALEMFPRRVYHKISTAAALASCLRNKQSLKGCFASNTGLRDAAGDIYVWCARGLNPLPNTH